MSSDIRKIILPAGRQFVDVSDVLTWIVEAKFPIPDGPPELSNLRKLVPQENQRGFREEELDEGDVELLSRIWQAVPGIWPLAAFAILRAGETKRPRNPHQGEFKKFAQAFDLSPERPAWELSPEFTNYARQAEKRRQSAKQEHWGNMEREAADGRIRLLGVSGAPTAKIDWQTQLSVEDARKYLAGVPPGILLEVAPAEVAHEPVVRMPDEAPGHAFELDAPKRQQSREKPETIAFRNEVHRLMGVFWNQRAHGSNPTKAELHEQVCREMMKGSIRGRGSKLNVSMVKDASKSWKKPLEVPSNFDSYTPAVGRHPWKEGR